MPTKKKTKKYTPTITKVEFDQEAPKLREVLKVKYDASKADSERPPDNAATAGAFDHVPDLDSKTVARWSSTIKSFLGCRLDPELIRKGGYNSFEDFWNDVSPKLRTSCPGPNAGISPTQEASLGE